ncbi:MAG: hypothetical protein GXP33_09470 [Spirochaetes bacterium]|nr:hypothetical protein [Spirochaetota bacterium]
MSKKKLRIASYLISKGLISVEHAREIMEEQETRKGVTREMFGRMAVKKGYITEDVLNRAVIAKEREEAGYL